MPRLFSNFNFRMQIYKIYLLWYVTHQPGAYEMKHYGKRLNGFSWNFQCRWDLVQGTIRNIFRLLYLTSRAQNCFFFGGIRDCSQYCGKTFERIFMKFSAKHGHETRNNLKHFRDVVVNTLNSGLIFLFPGTVFVSNIMEEGMNGFSWNFHEISGRTQKIICLDCFISA